MSELNNKSSALPRNQFCEAARDVRYLERDTYVALAAGAAGVLLSIPAGAVGGIAGPAGSVAAVIGAVSATSAAGYYVNNKIKENERRTPAQPKAGMDCVGDFLSASNRWIQGSGGSVDPKNYIYGIADKYPDVQKAMFYKEYPAGPDDIRITPGFSPTTGAPQFTLLKPSVPGVAQ